MGSSKVDDMHVVGYDTLVAPEDLIADLPLSASGRATVVSARDAGPLFLSRLVISLNLENSDARFERPR